MIRLSPPGFSYVQVERPVVEIEGAKRFLALAQSIGDSILGEELVGPTIRQPKFDIRDIDDEDEDQLFREPQYEDTPVALPVFETTASNDLSMVLVHKGVKRDLAKRSGIVTVVSNLSRSRDSHYFDVIRPDGREDRAKKTLPNLMEQLSDIAIAHGFKNPDRMPVVCNRADVIEVPGDNYILGLSAVPGEKASKVLHDQAKVINDRLVIKNKQLTRVSTPSLVVMPFARFPRDVPNDDFADLLTELNDPKVMGTLRFVIGAPQVTPH